MTSHTLPIPLNCSAFEEKNLSTFLRLPVFNPIMPYIFSYLSPLEFLYLPTVDHRWAQLFLKTKQHFIKKLYLGQFWSKLGVIDSIHFTRVVADYNNIRDLNLGYSNQLKGDTLLAVIKALLNNNQTKLEKLDLFYCYELIDQDILDVARLCADLKDLNLGRVFELTNNVLPALAALPHLKGLSLYYNGNITPTALLPLLEDTTKFPALATLNIVDCALFDDKKVEDQLAALKSIRPGLKVTGPQEVHPNKK